MKKEKHILDNKMTYMDFLSLTENIEFKIEKELSKLEKKLSKLENNIKKEVQYEIY